MPLIMSKMSSHCNRFAGACRQSTVKACRARHSGVKGTSFSIGTEYIDEETNSIITGAYWASAPVNVSG